MSRVNSTDRLAIDLRYVAKTYRRKVHALRGIAMRVQAGEVFGLLGPNGAGKSTLVKIMMTVIRPTRAEGELLARQLERFMDEYIYPAEYVAQQQIEESGDPHHMPEVLVELKAKAKEIGLWNLFLPDTRYGAGLTNTEYAPLCEIMGRSLLAPTACNCAAPDTGNMEIMLSREMANRRLWPAIDLNLSGTRKEERLLTPEALEVSHQIRRRLLGSSPVRSMELLLEALQREPDNAGFVRAFAERSLR